MAPVAALGRERAIQLVANGRLPISFGSPHPTVAILEQDGVLRIRELVVDEAESRAAGERALANHEAWMPEHHHALARPTGKIYAEAASREQLIEQMRAMSWPASW